MAMQEIELWVPMCCSKCEEKVREELLELDGACEIFCDQVAKRVTVQGYIDPFEALKKVKRVKRKSEFWKGGAAPKLTRSTSFRSSPRQQESYYHSSPSRVSYFRQQPSHSENFFHATLPYDDSRQTSFLRPSSPDSFECSRSQSFRYERVPPYAQTYYTEDYPHSYRGY
jgi:hypothetical protein